MKENSPKKKLIRTTLSYIPKSARNIFSGNFPKWAYIYLTRKCNVKCDYCFSTDNNMPEMSSEELKNAVDKIHGLGTRYVSFFGGEPTLRRKELTEIIKYASLRKDMFTQLPTNGTLLTEKYLRELGQSGLDMIDLSFDSMGKINGSKKNLIDRTNLFEKVNRAREEYNFAIKINHVITPQNHDELDAVMEFAQRNNILISARLAFQPSLAPPSTKWDKKIYFQNNAKDIETVKHISKKLIDKKKHGYITSEPIAFYKAMPRFVKGNTSIWKCDAVKHNLTIDADGRVKICGSVPCGTGDLGIHFSELTPNYYKKLQETVNPLIQECNDKCLAAAYFCSNHYRRHPVEFIRNVISKDRKNSIK